MSIKVIYSIFSGKHLLGDYELEVSTPQELHDITNIRGVRIYAFINPKTKEELFDGHTDGSAVKAAIKYLGR